MSSLAFLIYDSLHEMMYGSCKRKSILASYREPNQNWIFQSNLYASSYQPIFYKPKACHKTFSEKNIYL